MGSFSVYWLSMHPALENLLIIQDRDSKINALKFQQKHIPVEEAQIAENLKNQSSALEALKLRAKHVETDRKKLELEVQGKQDSINKFRNQQNLTKKNEEYQALTHQIESFGKDIVSLEDQELALMEETEKLRAQIAEEEKNVKAYVAQATIQREDLAKKSGVIAAELSRLNEEKVSLVAGVDRAVFSKYERIMVSKGDAAVVPLLHGNTCGGCHMKVIAQTIHAVKAAHEVTHCELCGRMLYFAE